MEKMEDGKPAYYDVQLILRCISNAGDECKGRPYWEGKRVFNGELAFCDEFRADSNYENCLRQQLGDFGDIDKECIVKAVRMFWNGECTMEGVKKRGLKFMNQTVPHETWRKYFVKETSYSSYGIEISKEIWDKSYYKDESFSSEAQSSRTSNKQALKKVDRVLADIRKDRRAEVLTEYFAGFSYMNCSDKELCFADVIPLSLRQNTVFVKIMIELYLETDNAAVADAIVRFARNLSEYKSNYDGFSVVLAAMDMAPRGGLSEYEYGLRISALKARLGKEFLASQEKIRLSPDDEVAKARYIVIQNYFSLTP